MARQKATSPSDFLQRIKSGESQSTEFKREFPDSARDLGEVIAGFATSYEGYIYLGVTNDGSIVGLPRDNGPTEVQWKDEIQKRILGVARGIEPRIRVEVSFHEIEGKVVCEIFVPKGMEPIYYVGGIPYLRDLNETRKATPQEVKDLHRQYFQAAAPGAGLSELLVQLADLDIILSDTEKRIGDDLKQWRYDLQATAQAIRSLSVESAVASIGAEKEGLSIANDVENLSTQRLYIDGGKSWSTLLDENARIRIDASGLASRVGKNLSFTAPEASRLKQTALQHLRLLENELSRRQEFLTQGRLATLRTQLHQSAFVFARLAKQFQVSGETIPGETSGKIASSLRSLDSNRVFKPGIGTNPIELMEPTVKEILGLAQELGQALTAGT